MKTYILHVKVDGHWQWVCRVKAETYREALRQAISQLDPQHYEKAIRLEEENAKPHIESDKARKG